MWDTNFSYCLASANVLGTITAASSIEVSGYEPPTPPEPVPPAPEVLPVLFSFASADYVGNLYSNLYGGSSRYGNNFEVSFSLINALSSSELYLTLAEINGVSLASNVITFILKSGDTKIGRAHV